MASHGAGDGYVLCDIGYLCTGLHKSFGVSVVNDQHILYVLCARDDKIMRMVFVCGGRLPAYSGTTHTLNKIAQYFLVPIYVCQKTEIC